MTTFPAIVALLQTPPPPARGPSTGLLFLQMALIFAIVYFLMIRPKIKQEREHRDRVSQLKKGDRVVTAGGVLGEVVHLKDDQVTLKSGDSRFIVLRDRVVDIRNKTPKS